MDIRGYERIPLKGWILEQTRLIFGRAPPLRRELADLSLGALFWNARDESAFAINDADNPVPRDITRTEEGKQPPCSHGNGQPPKGLAVPVDWDFDIDDPVLRDGTLHDIGDDNIARCPCAFLGVNRNWIATWQGKVRLCQGVDKLLAIYVGDQYPCTSP
jgi:hypothetical protein